MVDDGSTERVFWAPWGRGMSVALTQRSQWKHDWTHKDHESERNASAAWSLFQSHTGVFTGIRRPHDDLVDSPSRYGHSVVAVLCDGDFITDFYLLIIEIGTLNCRIAWKFDRHVGSPAADVPVKFHSDRTILKTNLTASKLYEILRKDVFSDIETRPVYKLLHHRYVGKCCTWLECSLFQGTISFTTPCNILLLWWPSHYCYSEQHYKSSTSIPFNTEEYTAGVTKMSSYQYRDSHYNDESISRPCYLSNPHTWKNHVYIETLPWCQRSGSSLF